MGNENHKDQKSIETRWNSIVVIEQKLILKYCYPYSDCYS